MSEQNVTQPTDLAGVVTGYIEAFRSQDPALCTSYFTEDAVLHFVIGVDRVFRGKTAIEEWHKERFKAQFEILKVEGIRTKADSVTLDASITSSRLRKWRINSVGGRAIFRIDLGKFREAKFSPRVKNPVANA